MTIDRSSPMLKDRLRSQLERARADYYRFLESVTDEHWSVPSANTRWTVGGEFAHVAAGLGTVPLRMESARTGKPIQWMPAEVFDSVNMTLTQELSRQHNLGSVRGYFDEHYAAATMLLEGVDDSEWDLLSQTYIQRWTVREIFDQQAAHIAEHLRNIAGAVVAPRSPERHAGSG